MIFALIGIFHIFMYATHSHNYLFIIINHILIFSLGKFRKFITGTVA